jgi:two-component system cell cycle sensor histidine kinase/response regulator CckA
MHRGPFGPTRAIPYIARSDAVSANMGLPLRGPSPETILVVEDDAAILKLVQLILEDAGFEVLVASSAKRAGVVEADFPRTIHLLLSDIMMPDMCGPDLAALLKRRRPEMRVMLMSGYADGAMLVLNHGWYFIGKPFLPSALVGRVTDVLHTKVRDQGTYAL